MENISVLAIMAVILLFAFLAETLTEFLFGDLFEQVPALNPYKWCLKYIAVVVGVAGAFVYQFDIIYLLGNFLQTDIVMTSFGIAISGVAIGKGSNYIHDLITKFFVES